MAKNLLPLLLAPSGVSIPNVGPHPDCEGRAPDAARDIFGFTSKQSFIRKRSTGTACKPATLVILERFFPSHPRPALRSNYHLFNRSWLFASFSFREPLTKDLQQHEPNVSRQAFASQEGPGWRAPVIGHRIHSPSKTPVVQPAESQLEKMGSVHLS